MPMANDYNEAHPIFNWEARGGLLYPYFPLSDGQQASNRANIDLDGSASVILARIRFPFPIWLMTCDAFAVADANGAKTAAASTEPIIHMTYGPDGLASIEAGTEIVLITCDGAGAVGKDWKGTTTPTRIDVTDEIILALKTAASSATSSKADGAAVVRMWIAQINSP